MTDRSVENKMTKRPAHRPFGSGSSDVVIRPRTNNVGFFLFIGRKIWQEIGQPERVILSGAEGHWLIESAAADDGYHVSNAENDGMPRLAIGKAVIGSLGLAAGVYPTMVYPLRKQIVFQAQD